MYGKILIEAVASLLALFMVVAPAIAADFKGEVIRVLEATPSKCSTRTGRNASGCMA
jgi:hypothetical protein